MNVLYIDKRNAEHSWVRNYWGKKLASIKFGMVITHVDNWGEISFVPLVEYTRKALLNFTNWIIKFIGRKEVLRFALIDISNRIIDWMKDFEYKKIKKQKLCKLIDVDFRHMKRLK